MAESKGIGRMFSRKVTRTKEKVLQNLGKADKTTDNTFDDHVANLNKQQNTAVRLQKELKNYLVCVRAMSEASARFYTTVAETYEEEWMDHDDIQSAVEQLQFLWDDYMMKLADSVQNPVNAYVAKFPEVRARIAKRGRKLVDFDSARHNFESLQSAKKRDEQKIQKAQEELNDARQIYMEMNNQMLEELPQLYESRVGFMASHFNALFSTECKFQEESAKLKAKLSDATERLSKEHNVGPILTNTYKPFTNGDADDSGAELGLSKFYNLPGGAAALGVGGTGGRNSRNSDTHSRNSDARSSRASSAGDASPLSSPAAKERHTEDVEFPPRQNGTSPQGSGRRQASPRQASPQAQNRLDSPTEEQSYEPINVSVTQQQQQKQQQQQQKRAPPPAPAKFDSSDEDAESDDDDYLSPPAPVAVPRDSFSTMHASLAPTLAKTVEKPREMPPLPSSVKSSTSSSQEAKPKEEGRGEADGKKTAEVKPQAPVRPQRPSSIVAQTEQKKSDTLTSTNSSSDDDVFEESVVEQEIVPQESQLKEKSMQDSLALIEKENQPQEPQKSQKSEAEDDFQGFESVAPGENRRFSELMSSMPPPPWEAKKKTEQKGTESEQKGAGSEQKGAGPAPAPDVTTGAAATTAKPTMVVEVQQQGAVNKDEPQQKPEPAVRASIAVDDTKVTKPVTKTTPTSPDADRPPALTPPPDPSSCYDDAMYSVAGGEEDDNIYTVPSSNQAVDSKVPKGTVVLYNVLATHPYVGEDTDELTFEPGDIVAVIPFEDPEDQDEGWLYGIKETTGERGVFPANFTQKV